MICAFLLYILIQKHKQFGTTEVLERYEFLDTNWELLLWQYRVKSETVVEKV